MTPRRLRAEIDRTLCVGTSNCAEAAAEAYEMDEDCAPHAASEADPAALLAGAEACPVGAISVFDRDSGAQVYP